MTPDFRNSPDELAWRSLRYSAKLALVLRLPSGLYAVAHRGYELVSPNFVVDPRPLIDWIEQHNQIIYEAPRPKAAPQPERMSILDLAIE